MVVVHGRALDVGWGLIPRRWDLRVEFLSFFSLGFHCVVARLGSRLPRFTVLSLQSPPRLRDVAGREGPHKSLPRPTRLLDAVRLQGGFDLAIKPSTLGSRQASFLAEGHPLIGEDPRPGPDQIIFIILPPLRFRHLCLKRFEHPLPIRLIRGGQGLLLVRDV